MFKNFARSHIVLFDGAMGTSIQKKNVSESVWQGKNGCNEFLNLAAPEIIYSIHKDYFEAGANVAVTNTFGAIASVLAEYGLEDRVAEINMAAVETARKAASGYENAFVSLSIGPGTKLAGLGHTTYDALYAQYLEQAESVSVDLYNIETAQDIIQMKAAVNACLEANRRKGEDTPVLISFTVEQNGTLLTGSDISAVAAVMRSLPIFALGLNCAMGPDMLEAPLSKLVDIWEGELYISPNAGLPETLDGETVYPMNDKKFSQIMEEILSRYPVTMAGGCCGTDASHIRALRKIIDKKSYPSRRKHEYKGVGASLYAAVTLEQTPPPAMIGERANATGSRAFKEMLLESDDDGILALCKKQEEEGAHFIDLSAAYAGRDEKGDFKRLVPLLNAALTAPLVIDSTDPAVIAEAVKLYSGKPVINSVNFEDGGIKLKKIFDIVKEHPACVTALTIDEEGMAQTLERKVAIAKRIFKTWKDEYGFPAEDLIIDALTFSIGSGEESLKTAALETLSAIEKIKKDLPGVKTVLGLSNVSFGLSPSSRPVLNSVFLREAVKAGLDMAIVHPSKLIPVEELSREDAEVCINLIYNKKDDALEEFISRFSNRQRETAPVETDLPPLEALPLKIIRGDKSGLKEIIEAGFKEIPPEDMINDVLFPAMQKVGDLFGEGKMLLPFVLKSAETMKAAVTLIEPKMEKKSGKDKGSVVIATVQGDVHDIGKNLADIIMSNNGFKVHNLGIKVPVSEMIQKAMETGASAIGMSGLLVKSTQIMKENIEEIAKKLPDIKVMLGGAALTSKFVRESCAPIMPGKVFYCKDAFDNISAMEGTKAPAEQEKTKTSPGKNPPLQNETVSEARIREIPQADIPEAPFYGTKIIEDASVEEIFRYLNKFSLFSNSWGYKRRNSENREYEDLIKNAAIPELEALKKMITDDKAAEPKAIYGYFKARRAGTAVEVYAESGGNPLCVFRFPRRKREPYDSLADYISEDKTDVLPMQIVTLGSGPVAYCKKLFQANNYKDYYMAHGLFTALTEAFTELVHARIRRELRIDKDDGTSMESLLSCKYRGRRYSFGYPLAPDIENNAALASLLSAQRVGVEVNDIYQMVPEYSTSAIIIHHPMASY